MLVITQMFQELSISNAIDVSRRRIRGLLIFFIIALVISGLTAFPLVCEVGMLHQYLGEGTATAERWPELAGWITRVYHGVTETDARHPFILYGTDWLAFAHLTIAVAFWGPVKDPIRNVWVIEFGMIACLMIVPLALICGSVRGIPFYWQLIDCSFGVVGIIPLGLARRGVKRIEALGQRIHQ
jgi:uncharacterized membrane protein YccF (DUF307 family)